MHTGMGGYWQTAIHTHTHTFCDVLHGFPDSSVEGAGVGGTLEGQATLLVVHLPVMKGWGGLGVLQVLPQETLQDYLCGSTRTHIQTY